MLEKGQREDHSHCLLHGTTLLALRRAVGTQDTGSISREAEFAPSPGYELRAPVLLIRVGHGHDLARGGIRTNSTTHRGHDLARGGIRATRWT